jgi:hypothetical protein
VVERWVGGRPVRLTTRAKGSRSACESRRHHQGLGTAAGTYAQVRRYGDRRLRLPDLLVRVDGCPVEEKHAHPAALGLMAIDSTSLPA